MRYGGDCCHYDEGYDDGYDDGQQKVARLGGDVSLVDLINAWARLQYDPAKAEAGFALADMAGGYDLEYLSERIKKRRERLLSQYAATRQSGTPEPGTGDSQDFPSGVSRRV